jgi:tRNA 5-methylaminomethyl-2-thiouridine biosynthesis bifunctional protein
LAFDAQGRLYSELYDSVHHGGLDPWLRAQQIFLQGSALPARWAKLPYFTVLETGFGAGLNFLALWRAWRADPARPGRLHVISLEAHPYTQADMRTLLTGAWGAGEPALAAALAAAWPPLLPGLHRLDFDNGAVSLTLAFGCAGRVSGELRAEVDAYFFDGYAPRRNPAAWSEAGLAALARLAAPGATAVAAVADAEAAAALARAGFAVCREAAGAGRPTMLTATLAPRDGGAYLFGVGTAASAAPGASAGAPEGDAAGVGASRRVRHDGMAGLRASAFAPLADALVVGGGLAGASVARALASRGIGVTVLDGRPGGGPGSPHWGHASAALTPLVSREDDIRARLSRAGSQRALRRWSELAGGGAAAFERRGTLQMARDPERAAKQRAAVEALGFPADWVRFLEADAASAIAGVALPRGGLYFADGMQVRPAVLIRCLLDHPAIQRRQAQAAALRQVSGGWEALDATGAVLARAAGVVLANSAGAAGLLAASGLAAHAPRLAQMQALAGEVTQVPLAALEAAGNAAGAAFAGPRCIVSGEGYLLPAQEGACVAGSTYVHDSSCAGVTPEGQKVNLDKAAALLGLDRAGVASWPGILPGWAGWRAVMPGRLPCVGALAAVPGVWLATGYASRGLSWSALAGELIGGQWCNEPSPLEISLTLPLAPR